MALRDRFMRGLLEARAANGILNERSKGELGEPILTEAARLSLLFEGIKLVGTGNGAGALASVAALYYFSSKPDVQVPIRFAAIAYIVGILIFGLAVIGYVFGLISTTRFVDEFPSVADAKKIPVESLNRALDGLMLLAAALLGTLVSLACFFIGTAIALYILLSV